MGKNTSGINQGIVVMEDKLQNSISTNKLYAEYDWFQNTFPATQSKVFIDCAALDRSGFRDIIHILANTHKFKKRMKTLILFLYEINNLFSYKHKRIKN